MFRSQCQPGFTLIELIIVVAIIALIATIAYPSYNESVRKSRRADATTALLELAEFMTRTFVENKSYQPGGVTPTLPLTETPREGADKMYDLTVVATATTYTLMAVPKNSQIGDKCGSLTYTHISRKEIVGAHAGVDIADCW